MHKIEQLFKQYWFVLIFCIAIPLYTVNISYGDLWNDETFTKELVSYSLPEMMELLSDDYHPTLYFIALKLLPVIPSTMKGPYYLKMGLNW